MKATSFSICADCIHIKYCVLTEQKDKVWSCSDYDNSKGLTQIEKNGTQPAHYDMIND